MGKYDNLIPVAKTAAKSPVAQEKLPGFSVAPFDPFKAITEKTAMSASTPQVAAPKPVAKAKSNVPVAEIPVAKAPVAATGKYAHLVPGNGTSTPSAGGKYAALIPKKEEVPQYFSGETEGGGTIGLSETEKDGSGRPFFAYRNPGDTATTTDYTRTAVQFDPRKAQKVTRDSFYNPRAIDDVKALKLAMGGSYSDELDHKIAVALSGSNDPKNLRPIDADKNDDSPKILALQKKVINGEMSLMDAQVELAREKGVEIPWTPAELKKMEKENYGSFLDKIKGAATSALLGIDKLTDRPENAGVPYFEPRKAGETQQQYSARLLAYNASPEYQAYQKEANKGTLSRTLSEIPSKVVENPFATFGAGAIVKQARDNPESVQGFDLKKGAVEGSLNFVKGFAIAPVLTVAGAIREAATGGKTSSQINFNIPGLGQFTNAQANAAARITAGENVSEVILDAVPQSIFDVLFLAGLAGKATTPREVVTNRFAGDVNNVPGVNLQPKFNSFREYTPPKTSSPLNQKVVQAMEKQGMTLGPKYNPNLPTFFRIRGTGKGGQVIGEVVQVKPSYFESVFGTKRSPTQASSNLPAVQTKVSALPKEAINVVATKSLDLEAPEAPTQANAPETNMSVSRPETSPTTQNIDNGKPLSPVQILNEWDANRNGKIDPVEQQAIDTFQDVDVSSMNAEEAYDAYQERIDSVIDEDIASGTSLEKAIDSKKVNHLYAKRNSFLNKDIDAIEQKLFKSIPASNKIKDRVIGNTLQIKKGQDNAGFYDVVSSATKNFLAAENESKVKTDIIELLLEDMNLDTGVFGASSGFTTEGQVKLQEKLAEEADDIYDSIKKTIIDHQSVKATNQKNLPKIKGVTTADKLSKPTTEVQRGSVITDKEESLQTAAGTLRFDITESQALKRLSRIFNPGELDNVRFKSEITNESGEALGGQYLRLKGLGTNVPRQYIEVLTRDGKVSKDVTMHEAFHAYFNMFEDAAFRRKMLSRVQKFSLITKSGKYTAYDTPNARAEEFLADDFADWYNQKAGGPKYKGIFGRIWEKLSNFFKGLRRMILKADELYEDIINKKRPTSPIKEETRSVPVKRGKILDDDRRSRIEEAVRKGEERAKSNAINKYEERKNLMKGAPDMPVVESLFETFKGAMNPLRAVDFETRDIFNKWRKDIIAGKERARKEYTDMKEAVPQGMDIINEYEAGSGKYKSIIKSTFDDLRAEAIERDLSVDFVENYLPHVYSNSLKEQDRIILEALMAKGMEKNEAIDYMNEKPLNVEAQRRLKLKPNFEKERIFPTYAEARAAGLRPKYEGIADLVAYYVAEMEKSVAGRTLIGDLEMAGKIQPEVQAPSNWSLLNPQFSMSSTYKASAPVARVINGMFPDTNVPSFARSLFNITAGFSKKIQDIMLSGGVPRSNINYFSMGQMIKEVTAGNFEAIKAFARANFEAPSLRYFEEKDAVIQKMAKQGIDLSGRLGDYGSKSFKALLENKEWKDALGYGFDKLFNEKTFASFMPQIYIGLFDKVYNAARAKGMNETAAGKLAGDTVKNNFGLLDEGFARSKLTENVLSTFLFAPKFREGIIRTLAKTGYAGWDFATKGKNANRAYRSNMRLLTGMVLSFILYQLINEQTSGTPTWENPDGRKFAIRIPQENGDVLYVEFMPSFFAFPRMMATGVMAAASGDFKLSAQKFGGLMSSPVKLTTDVLANEDYFGREIYKDSDTTGIKSVKIAAYFGLNANHPYVREIVNMLQEKNPVYQSVFAMFEVPVKFSSLDKESKSAFYKEYRAKQLEESRRKEKFLPTFLEIRALADEGKVGEAQSRVDALTEAEYTFYKSLLSTMKSKKTSENKAKAFSTYEKVQQFVAAGDESSAQSLLDSLTDDEYKAYQSVKKQLKK